eukprot:TRINITY_DN9796_c0_g1_i1.p1 TRINITY_DN9796_c0_g1~~TRINITY_DN9796_c0_g1_i1.p1  ORF type:complete len:580 (+),score=51.15 TRINITY_DN9796_c0_g1_i1:94-1740(+)
MCGAETGAKADNVLIIGVDGMGGMFVEQALDEMPNLSRLMRRGTSTMRARTVFPSISAPAWTAVLTSQGPVESGVKDNDWEPTPRWTQPSFDLSAIRDCRARKKQKCSDGAIAFMFVGDTVYKWNLEKDDIEGAPKKISEEFADFPFPSVDATLVFPDGVGPSYTKRMAYMFHGGKYCKWNLDTHRLHQGPRNIACGFSGFPFPKVDAVLVFPPGVGPSYAQNKAYMFYGDQYCKWNLNDDSLDAKPRSSWGSPKFPFPRIDSVLVFPQGVGPDYTKNKAYLFHGDQYCKWDLETDDLHQEPRSISSGFESCICGVQATLPCNLGGGPLNTSEKHAVPSVSGIGVTPETLWTVAKAAWKAEGIVGRTSTTLGWDWIHYLCADCDDLCREGPDAKAVEAMQRIISRIMESNESNQKPSAKQLMFIHLDDVDHAGHAHGWGSEAYYKAMRTADEQIGALLDSLEEAGLTQRTLVICIADHGGNGHNHGGFTQAELFVPFVVAGPGVKAGVTLQDGLTAVSLLDVAPTALHALGIGPGRHMRGRVVQELWC